jgi:hypothetical protein
MTLITVSAIVDVDTSFVSSYAENIIRVELPFLYPV